MDGSPAYCCERSWSRAFYPEESGWLLSQQPLSLVCSINFRKSHLRSKRYKDFLNPAGSAYVD